MTFKEEMKERTEVIEKLLVKYLPKAEGYQSQIMEAMEYSVMAGGKRLRPMLMQETYRLFGGEGKEIEPFMAAMEMIHTYSLVHDDLPAMDNDGREVVGRSGGLGAGRLRGTVQTWRDELSLLLMQSLVGMYPKTACAGTNRFVPVNCG